MITIYVEMQYEVSIQFSEAFKPKQLLFTILLYFSLLTLFAKSLQSN